MEQITRVKIKMIVCSENVLQKKNSTWAWGDGSTVHISNPSTVKEEWKFDKSR